MKWMSATRRRRRYLRQSTRACSRSASGSAVSTVVRRYNRGVPDRVPDPRAARSYDHPMGTTEGPPDSSRLVIFDVDGVLYRYDREVRTTGAGRVVGGVARGGRRRAVRQRHRGPGRRRRARPRRLPRGRVRPAGRAGQARRLGGGVGARRPPPTTPRWAWRPGRAGWPRWRPCPTTGRCSGGGAAHPARAGRAGARPPVRERRAAGGQARPRRLLGGGRHLRVRRPATPCSSTTRRPTWRGRGSPAWAPTTTSAPRAWPTSSPPTACCRRDGRPVGSGRGSPRFPAVEGGVVSVSPFTTIDLFAGAGGLSLGFGRAGFAPPPRSSSTRTPRPPTAPPCRGRARRRPRCSNATSARSTSRPSGASTPWSAAPRASRGAWAGCGGATPTRATASRSSPGRVHEARPAAFVMENVAGLVRGRRPPGVRAHPGRARAATGPCPTCWAGACPPQRPPRLPGDGPGARRRRPRRAPGAAAPVRRGRAARRRLRLARADPRPGPAAPPPAAPATSSGAEPLGEPNPGDRHLRRPARRCGPTRTTGRSTTAAAAPSTPPGRRRRCWRRWAATRRRGSTRWASFPPTTPTCWRAGRRAPAGSPEGGASRWPRPPPCRRSRRAWPSAGAAVVAVPPGRQRGAARAGRRGGGPPGRGPVSHDRVRRAPGSAGRSPWRRGRERRGPAARAVRLDARGPAADAGHPRRRHQARAGRTPGGPRPRACATGSTPARCPTSTGGPTWSSPAPGSPCSSTAASGTAAPSTAAASSGSTAGTGPTRSTGTCGATRRRPGC